MPAERLSKEIDDFNEAWKRLTKIKQVLAINKGYIRKLEITYNKKWKDYHTHFHILIAVNYSYFKEKNLYISRNKWLEMWQMAKRDKSIKQVDIRAARMYNLKSVMEIATYSAKASDYLLNSDIFTEKEWYKWFEKNYQLEWSHEVLVENLEKVYKNEIETD